MNKNTVFVIARKTFAASAVAAVAAIVAFHAGKARADGIPSTPLVYSGYLEDGVGKPVSGPIAATVKLFGAETGGNALCTTASTVQVGNGWFSVPLENGCTAAVKGAPDQWAEMTVGITTLPRQRISAVPYAVEAGRATTSLEATAAGGALRAELDGTKGAVATAAAQLGAGLSVRISTQCADASGVATDCTCADGETAIGGGAYVGPAAGGFALRENRKVDNRTWRIACVSPSGPAACEAPQALCVRGSTQ
jgi:hypothetical protein